MKKSFLIAATLLTAMTGVHAQQRPHTFAITPKVGLTMSNVTNKMPVSVDYMFLTHFNTEQDAELHPYDPSTGPISGGVHFTDNQSKVGFTIGAEAQYQIDNRFGISLGTYYIQQGTHYNMKGYSPALANNVRMEIHDDLKLHLDYISIPVLVNCYLWKGLALKAGVQPELAVSKKLKGDVSIAYQGSSATATDNKADYIRSFAFTIPVGMSYEYKQIVADLRYHIGVTNLVDEESKSWGNGHDKSYHTSTLSLTLGYKFEL